MKIIASLLCYTLLSALACHSATAASDVEVELRTRVVGIYDPANVLSGTIQIGDVFDGSYGYDSTIPRQQIGSNAGRYEITGNVAHMRLASGPTVFETQPANTWGGFIEIFENPSNSGGQDAFALNFFSLRPLPNGTTVQSMTVQFRNYDGTAPITAELPTTAPDLQYWPMRIIDVSGQLNSNYYAVTLQIEAATLVVPPIIEVSPSASKFLPQQRFDAVLLLPVGSNIVSAHASANGMPLALSYPGTCVIAPPNSQGRPAILCPDAHAVLGSAPTATQVDWSVELAGGTVLNKSVQWTLLQ